MDPLAGARLTLISLDLEAPYSGMLPGFVAGHYSHNQAHIDLGPLTRFAGGRFIHDEVIGLDLTGKRVLCKNRPAVPYDILSINTGAAPSTRNVQGALDSVVPIKPIDGFVDNWRRLRERLLSCTGPIHVGIVGAGAGGVEMAFAIQHRLHELMATQGREDAELAFSLLTAEDDIMATHSRPARAKVRRALAKCGIEVHAGHRVADVSPGVVRCDNGATFTFDEILWATNASAPSWLCETGLSVSDAGFIRVNAALQSISHAEVFAAGDIADVINHPRPKSGVFAIRQGRPLARNLRQALTGRRLRQFLSLITTGDKRAIASRAWRAVEGRCVWHWKDWIDRRFIQRFNRLPEMPPAEGPFLAAGLADTGMRKRISDIGMRCGGCGAKVGATVTRRALSQLDQVERDDVVIGLRELDDAAVVTVPPGKLMVHTVDSFRSFVEDPFTFGQIAASHALGDIYAMGGEPQTALAITTVPFGPEAKVENTLAQMMVGAQRVLNDAGTALVGGHTGEGRELSLGFAVNGLVDRQHILHKSGMCAGNRIILTKPIGIGTLFAADMRSKARGRWIAEALASMCQSNRHGANCLKEFGAPACTDLTGFGLLGHLLEMTKPSGVDVEINLGAVPLLDGALELAEAGILSSLHQQNVGQSYAIYDVETAAENPRYPLLFDPQTAGGLMASLPADQADDCIDALHNHGYRHAAIIGTVRQRSNRPEPIVLSS